MKIHFVQYEWMIFLCVGMDADWLAFMIKYTYHNVFECVCIRISYIPVSMAKNVNISYVFVNVFSQIYMCMYILHMVEKVNNFHCKKNICVK